MNFFILGCGRSGTSLVAGLFRNSGLNLGENSYKPRESNPKGFFEDRTINQINEEIISNYLPSRFTHNGITYGSDVPIEGQRWLARIPLDSKIIATPSVKEKIRDITQNTPFCFKDPRFCYTLDIWTSFVDQVKYIFVFRDPGEVVTSILTEIKRMPYLNGFSLSVDEAFETWRMMNQFVLKNHLINENWLFLNYMDLFDSQTLNKIENFAGLSIDKNFPDVNLKRSESEFSLDSQTAHIYNALLERST